MRKVTLDIETFTTLMCASKLLCELIEEGQKIPYDDLVERVKANAAEARKLAEAAKG